MALPIAYLTLRVGQAGPEAWGELLRPRTLNALLATTALAATVTAGAVAIGLPLAWLTTRADVPGRRAWAVLAALPLAVPSYVAAFAVLTFLGPHGLLQQALEGPFGVTRLPDISGFPGAALSLTLVSFPYVYISVAWAIAQMDPSLEEASRAVGAGPWRTFWRVTLPLLRPAIVAGALLAALYTLSDFGVVSLMRFGSLTQVIYSLYQASFDRSLAAMLGLELVLLAAVILGLEMRTRGRARYHRASSGAARRFRAVSLGRWRWPAIAFAGGITLACLALPLGVAAYWSIQGFAGSEGSKGILQAASNSALASGLAAGVTVAAALPVAIVSARARRRTATVVEGLAFSSYAAPGIVLALSLVFFAANYAPVVYQTLWLLVFAYVVRFLPQAVGPARASLLQVSPRLEEAARSVGRGSLQVLATVIVPLVRPGLAAGAALVFLTALKELPATLLLGPTGFETLATRIWTAADEGLFARAGVPALMLILLATLPMLFLLPRPEIRA